MRCLSNFALFRNTNPQTVQPQDPGGPQHPPPRGYAPPTSPPTNHQPLDANNQSPLAKILHLLSPYGEVGQLIAILVLVLLVVHITASIVWITTTLVMEAMAICITIVTMMNVLLIIGLFVRQKSIIIVWLWLHGLILVVGAVLDYPTIPISMIIITASCFLAVYILLQTFDHNIRIEVRYTNAFSSMAPIRGLGHTPPPGNNAGNPAGTTNPPTGSNPPITIVRPAGAQFTQPRPLAASRPDNNRLSDRELMTISETIAAQEMVIQQRYAAYMRYLTAADSELPSYEDVIQILKAEKEEKKKEKAAPAPEAIPEAAEAAEAAASWVAESPPPSYLTALKVLNAEKNNNMPDVDI